MPPQTLPQTPERVPVSSWYALGMLTLIYACHYLDRSVISIVAEPLRQEFALSDRALGMLTGLAYGLSFALAGLPMGYLIDRVNRRRLMASVVSVWSCMTVLAASAQSYTTLLLTRVLLGAAEAGGTPTAMSLITDMFPSRLRSSAMGVYYLGAGLGAAASAVIAGVVATHYGWRAAFVVAGVPGIFLGVLVWWTFKDVPRGSLQASPVAAQVPATVAPPMRSVFAFMGRQHAVVSLILAMALAAAGAAAIGAWMPSFLMRQYGQSLGQAGAMTALAFGLFGSLGTLLGGVAADRVARSGERHRLLFCAVMALVSVPAAVVGVYATAVNVALAGFFVAAFAVFTVFPSGFAMALGLMPAQMRGVAAATAQLTSNLIGYGVGPFAVGAISTGLGGSAALAHGMAMVCAGSMGLAAVALMLSWRTYDGAVSRAAQEAQAAA